MELVDITEGKLYSGRSQNDQDATHSRVGTVEVKRDMQKGDIETFLTIGVEFGPKYFDVLFIEL